MLYPVPKPERQPKRAPLKGRSPRAQKSGGHLFPRNVSLSRRAFVRRERCIATGQRTGEIVTYQPWMPIGWQEVCPYVCKVIAAHVDSRGAGHADAGDLVPLDAWIHQYVQHSWGWPAFERRLQLMPRAELAQLYETRFQAANANYRKSLESQAR